MTKVVVILCLIFHNFVQLGAVNHWIVTQTGKVQAFVSYMFAAVLLLHFTSKYTKIPLSLIKDIYN